MRREPPTLVEETLLEALHAHYGISAIGLNGACDHRLHRCALPGAKSNAAAVEGRIIFVGAMGGDKAQLPLGTLMGKRLRLIGTVLPARPLEQKMLLTQRVNQQLMPFFAAGVLRPVVDRVFALDRVADALQYMEENRNFGKIVLSMS